MEVTALAIFLAVLPAMCFAVVIGFGLRVFWGESGLGIALLGGMGLIVAGVFVGVYAPSALEEAIRLGAAGAVLFSVGLGTA